MNKDSKLLAEAYEIVKENSEEGYDKDKKLASVQARRYADTKKWTPSWRMREYGDEPKQQGPLKTYPTKVGDVFKDSKDRKWVAVSPKPEGGFNIRPYGNSGASEQKEGDVFTGKDGRKWIRVRKSDGSLGVKPFNG